MPDYSVKIPVLPMFMKKVNYPKSSDKNISYREIEAICTELGTNPRSILDTVAPPSATPTIYDDNDVAWTYTGSWSSGSQAGPYNNTQHWTSQVGAYASITFTGRQFKFIYGKDPNRGMFEVLVDDVHIDYVYTYDPNVLWQNEYLSPGFPNGSHTVKIKHAGGGTFIDVDAIQIIPQPNDTAALLDMLANINKSISGAANWQLGAVPIRRCICGTVNSLTIAAGGTEYLRIPGQGKDATENLYRHIIIYRGKVVKFYVNIGAQPTSGTMTFTFRKNGINTALMLTVAASYAGGILNVSGSIEYFAGDLLSIAVTNNAAAASAPINGWSFEYDQVG